MSVRRLHFVFWALLALSVRGAETTPEQASAAVRGWIATETPLGLSPQTSVAGAETRVAPDGATRIHVVTLSNGGYVLVPADDAIDPILVFSESGPVPDNDLGNPFWTLVCADLAARARSAEAVAHARERWANLLAAGGITPVEGRPRRSFAASPPSEDSVGVRVAPFLLSRWGQTTHDNTENGFPCFNLNIPEQYPCGCVATVGAQIMRHWEWPQSGVLPYERTCETNGIPLLLQGGGTNAYEWALMPFEPGTNETERAAIGRLTYDVAVSVGMRWTSVGGAATPYALALRLRDTFGYSNAVAAVFFENAYPYSLEDVKRIVVPNCDIRAPVAMAISGQIDGITYSHAVVVDGYGYSGGAFCMHVNFGWSGLSDAWYFPPDIGEYSVIDGFVFNVFPDLTGSIVSGRVLDESGEPVSGTLVELWLGSNVVRRTQSDANGVYGFVADPGTYRVVASWGQFSGSAEATAQETRGTALVQSSNDILIVLSADVCVGNSYDNDIVLSGLAPVPAPVFEPDSCTFHPFTNVVLSCTDPNARIHYTVDGRTPTRNSPVYSEPIFVDTTVTIRACAFVTGKPPSSVAEATYVYDVSADAPVGDYFSAPIVLSGGQGLYEISDNGNYSVEANEPLHMLYDEGYYYPQSQTVWYEWTSPLSGILTVRTFAQDGGSQYPTGVAVYLGDSLNTAERLAFNSEPDDEDTDWSTSATLPVERNVTYRIVGMMLPYLENDPTSIHPCSFSMAWSLQRTETASTPVPVPYAWLSAFPSIGDGSDDAYEALAHADSDGDGFPNWAEYAANSDPASGSDFLRCDIGTSAAGALTVTVYPETAREGFPRILQGKVNLNDQDWTDLSAPVAPYRFFRYVIRLSP